MVSRRGPQTALLWLALSLACAGVAAVPSPARAPRALIVSIDGLRPDLLLRARMPNLRALMARGSFTMWAETVPAAVTLPSHVSMLTGEPPAEHGIRFNSDPPADRTIHPRRPTLFALARRAGYTTAMIAGKPKFRVLAVPGTLDRVSVPPRGAQARDDSLAALAVDWIERDAPRLFFVHLPGGDASGHDHGWGSDEQLAGFAAADSCVGAILAALERRGLLDSTLVLVTADHGGAGDTHGADDARSRFIPWIVAGPGVRQGWDLSRERDLAVRTEDTFATVAHLLGIPVPRSVRGRPVLPVLETPAR